MGAIIWLASYPKSGNTWTRAFLHNLLRDAKSPIPPDRFAEFCLGESKPDWYLRYLGKPLTEAKGEVAYSASFIEWFAEEGKRGVVGGRSLRPGYRWRQRDDGQ